jgi:hypothetical protein
LSAFNCRASESGSRDENARLSRESDIKQFADERVDLGGVSSLIVMFALDRQMDWLTGKAPCNKNVNFTCSTLASSSPDRRETHVFLDLYIGCLEGSGDDLLDEFPLLRLLAPVSLFHTSLV